MDSHKKHKSHKIFHSNSRDQKYMATWNVLSHLVENQ